MATTTTTDSRERLNDVLRNDAEFSRMMHDSNESVRAARNGDFSKIERQGRDPQYALENTADPIVNAIERADLTDTEKKELAFEALRQSAEALRDSVEIVERLNRAESKMNAIAMTTTLASIIRKTGPVSLTPDETLPYSEAQRLLHHDLTRDEDGTPRITYTVDLFSSEGGFHVPGNASVN